MHTPATPDAEHPPDEAVLVTLCTAATQTHDAATETAKRADPDSAAALQSIAGHCANAAEALASTGSRAILPRRGSTTDRRSEAAARDFASRTDDCLKQALDALGSEHEPLTPVDVLAISRAVTSLHAAHSEAEGMGL